MVIFPTCVCNMTFFTKSIVLYKFCELVFGHNLDIFRDTNSKSGIFFENELCGSSEHTSVEQYKTDLSRQNDSVRLVYIKWLGVLLDTNYDQRYTRTVHEFENVTRSASCLQCSTQSFCANHDVTRTHSPLRFKKS